MNPLKTVENKYNFIYPELYHQLFKDNMLDYGKAGSHWYKEVYPTLKDYPPLLLLANEYEQLSFEDIQNKMESFRDPNNYRHSDLALKLVPFAKSGAGDLYCFYISEQDGDNTPIVYVWHDMNRADYRAKNLQDFIFISLVDRVFDKEDFNDLSSAEFEESCVNTLQSHAKYLSSKQISAVEMLFNKEFIEKDVLSEIEYKAHISELAPYSKLGQSFKYQGAN